MEIYYGTTLSKMPGDMVYKNPSVFLAPVRGATSVTIDGHWPLVAAAYAKLGIPITLVGVERVEQPKPRPIPPTAYLPTAEKPTEQAAVEIPFGWQQSPWADLRRLAAAVSDTPIVNKEQAIAAIDTELKRREQGAL
jgi:hypothetical protein